MSVNPTHRQAAALRLCLDDLVRKTPQRLETMTGPLLCAKAEIDPDDRRYTACVERANTLLAGARIVKKSLFS